MPTQIKIIIGAAVAIFALGTALFFAQPKDSDGHVHDANTEVKNVLAVDKPNYDFGTISMKHGKVKTSFVVTNNQPEDITLAKLYTSCMCTKATLKINNTNEGPFGMQGHGFVPTFSQVFKPNQTAEIEVEFDPNAHGPSGVGVIEREITLEGKQGKLLTVGFKANVTP